MVDENFLFGFEKRALSLKAKALLRLKKMVSPRPLSKAPKKFQRALKMESEGTSGGPDSFVTWLPQMAAEKVWGKKKVHEKMWKHWDKPLADLDYRVGQVGSQIPVIGGLFKQKRKMPIHIPGRENVYQDVAHVSGMAPLNKIRKLALPIAGGIAIEGGLKKLREKKQNESH